MTPKRQEYAIASRYQSKCGVAQKWDDFGDVKRALHSYLMKTDKDFRERSESATIRNRAYQARIRAERDAARHAGEPEDFD